ncbi:MAG: phosphate/phosphite/phosphonate ABC transporter substrate-binding protein [Desulfobacterales bacterium]|nr:phosphate/phosphite/phosphonate ABC transporter substrate-binding protein [Desulfobacterales bacterium]
MHGRTPLKAAGRKLPPPWMRSVLCTMFRSAAAAVLVTFAAGCSDDGGYQQVDFSRVQESTEASVEVKAEEHLNVAVSAMVSPKETLSRYGELLDYIGKRVDRRIRLIQRKTYREVSELFLDEKLDIAFICSGPYGTGKSEFGFESLVTPVVRGEPFYQAYLIVHKDSHIDSFEALRNRTFAFTDPDSNTGALVPAYWLAKIQETPESFFKSYTYTYSHDNSIMAVAKSLVDAATVDGHIWEYENARNPIYTSRTRVIDRSIKFGSPPLVVSHRLSSGLRQQIKAALLLMHTDEEGRRILDSLMIDRFVESEESWYEPVKTLHRELSAFRETRQ